MGYNPNFELPESQKHEMFIAFSPYANALCAFNPNLTWFSFKF